MNTFFGHLKLQLKLVTIRNKNMIHLNVIIKIILIYVYKKSTKL